MSGLFVAIPLFFAQGAAPAAGAGASPNQGLWTILPYVAIIGLWFYLLMIRPQQKQEKVRRAMLDQIKKNDKVLTSAGIYGTVVSVDEKEDRIVLRIDDDRGIKVAFTKGSIVRVFDGSPKEKEKATATEIAKAE